MDRFRAGEWLSGYQPASHTGLHVFISYLGVRHVLWISAGQRLPDLPAGIDHFPPKDGSGHGEGEIEFPLRWSVPIPLPPVPPEVANAKRIAPVVTPNVGNATVPPQPSGNGRSASPPSKPAPTEPGDGRIEGVPF